MLLLTSLALAIGWYFERVNREQKHQEEIKQVTADNRDFLIGANYSVWAVHNNGFRSVLAEFCPKFDDPKEIERLVDGRMVGTVLSIWKHEQEIELFYEIAEKKSPSIGPRFTASKLAGESLMMLSCSSAEEFRSKVRTLKQYTDHVKYHPYIFEAGSEDYCSLSEFVERAIRDFNGLR